MHSIEVSEDVWSEIEARHKFPESVDDVLRRVLNLPPNIARVEPTSPPQHPAPRATARRRSMATRKQSSYVEKDQLRVSYYDGPSRTWALPDRSDKAGIRKVRDEAVAFARENGATLGQVNAVKKALTDSGYHVIK